MDVKEDWYELIGEGRLECLAPRADFRTPSDPVVCVGEAMAGAGFGDFVAAAAKGGPLSVVVNDAHRFTDTRSFIAALLLGLQETAASRIPLRLLVATGTHRADANERSDHEGAMLGDSAERFDEISWHDAHHSEGLRRLGAHEFHHWMAEGGCYLACGSMEPHYFAGVTGAHKTLTVGVMSAASIQANHAHAMSADAAGLRLDGNPVHEGIVGALGELENSGARLFAVNQVLTAGHMVACNAGHPLAALESGLPTVRRCFAHEVDARADLVIACVDPPLDRDLYQADKGIKNTEAAVRDGGVLIMEAACRQGLGIDHFVELLSVAATHTEALAVVERRGYRLGDHKAVRLRALTDRRRVNVGIVTTGIDRAMEGVLGARVFATRAQAAAWALQLLGDRPRCLLVEDAGNVSVSVGDDA